MPEIQRHMAEKRERSLEVMSQVLQSVTPTPRHRADTVTDTPIFEEIVADTGFRPARRFVGSQKQGKHVHDAN